MEKNTRSSTRKLLLASEKSHELTKLDIELKKDVFQTPRKRAAKSGNLAKLRCSPPKQKRTALPVDRDPSTPKTKSPCKLNLEDNNCPQLKEKTLSSNPRLEDKTSPESHQRVTQCHKTLRALQESSVTRPICREEEIGDILAYLQSTLGSQTPGSLYVTGPPGTGKTACVTYCTRNHKLKAKFQTIVVNCMTLPTARGIFRKIAEELGASLKRAHSLPDLLKHHLCKKGPMILLVLDEMDQLNTRHQEVLYNVFEWSSLPNSRLVLIGIANALEPLDRTLPRLKILTEQDTSILQFQPYTKSQIKAIVEDRLHQCKEDSEQLVTSTVVEYCSRNAAANNGDVRKALAMLSQATMIVMNAASRSSPRKQTTPLISRTSPRKELTSISIGRTSPRKQTLPVVSPCRTSPPVSNSDSLKRSDIIQVKLQHIQQVVNSVSSSLSWANAAKIQLPLQQKILVFCLMSLLKTVKTKDVTIGKLYEVYCSISRKKHLPVIDSSEVSSLCSQLEDSGIVGIKKNKDVRFAKISLRVDEMDLEPILRQEKLLAAMLDDKSSCQK